MQKKKTHTDKEEKWMKHSYLYGVLSFDLELKKIKTK